MFASTQERRLAPATEYLDACQDLVAARAAFFAELRAQFRGELPARQIGDAHWVASPELGTLIVTEHPEAGRNFRLTVLHLGDQLRVGVRLPAWHNVPASSAVARLAQTFPDRAPELGESEDDEALVTWAFSATELLSGPEGMAGPIYRVVAVFTAALQALVPTKKESVK